MQVREVSISDGVVYVGTTEKAYRLYVFEEYETGVDFLRIVNVPFNEIFQFTVDYLANNGNKMHKEEDDDTIKYIHKGETMKVIIQKFKKTGSIAVHFIDKQYNGIILIGYGRY